MFNCKTFLCSTLVGSNLPMHGEVDRNQVGFEWNSKIYLASKLLLWNNFLIISICHCQFGVFGSNNWGFLFLDVMYNVINHQTTCLLSPWPSWKSWINFIGVSHLTCNSHISNTNYNIHYILLIKASRIKRKTNQIITTKGVPCTSSDFTGFWVNSLVVVNGD